MYYSPRAVAISRELDPSLSGRLWNGREGKRHHWAYTTYIAKGESLFPLAAASPWKWEGECIEHGQLCTCSSRFSGRIKHMERATFCPCTEIVSSRVWWERSGFLSHSLLSSLLGHQRGRQLSRIVLMGVFVWYGRQRGGHKEILILSESIDLSSSIVPSPTIGCSPKFQAMPTLGSTSLPLMTLRGGSMGEMR